jgi:ABC-2 type transport system permease protein
MPAAARHRFPATVELFGHTLSIGTEIAIVMVFAAIFIGLAIRGFSRTE